MPAATHARAASASVRVFPLPAGPVITSTIRAEVSAWNSTALWSSRSPEPACAAWLSLACSCSNASSVAGSAPSSAAARSRLRCGAACRCASLRSCSSRLS